MAGAPRAITRLVHVWTLKRVTILVGALLSLLGSLGGQFYVDPAQKLSASLDGQIKDALAKVQILRDADAQFWSFTQQSALVFGLVASAGSDPSVKDSLANLHKLTITSGRRSMIPILAQLAIAGELDYRTTSDQHDKLLTAERDDFTWDNYQALNTF